MRAPLAVFVCLLTACEGTRTGEDGPSPVITGASPERALVPFANAGAGAEAVSADGGDAGANEAGREDVVDCCSFDVTLTYNLPVSESVWKVRVNFERGAGDRSVLVPPDSSATDTGRTAKFTVEVPIELARKDGRYTYSMVLVTSRGALSNAWRSTVELR